MADNIGSGGLFGVIQNQLDSMSSRDKKLLAGLYCFFGMLFVVVIALSLRGRLDDKASRVVTQKQSLVAIQTLQQDHAVAAARIVAAERRLREFGGKDLSAFVEEKAKVYDVSDELSVNKQQSEQVGGIEQTRYKVDLKRVSYDTALEFIYDIETSGYPLRVDNARFKRVRVKGDVFVNLTLEITAFSLEEA